MLARKRVQISFGEQLELEAPPSRSRSYGNISKGDMTTQKKKQTPFSSIPVFRPYVNTTTTQKQLHFPNSQQWNFIRVQVLIFINEWNFIRVHPLIFINEISSMKFHPRAGFINEISSACTPLFSSMKFHQWNFIRVQVLNFISEISSMKFHPRQGP